MSESPSAIWIYAAPDEASVRLGTLAPGETATPLAETQVPGGAKWFLIKSKTAITGWIKQSANDQAKKIDSFFKSRPAENTGVPAAIPLKTLVGAPRTAALLHCFHRGREGDFCGGNGHRAGIEMKPGSCLIRPIQARIAG